MAVSCYYIYIQYKIHAVPALSPVNYGRHFYSNFHYIARLNVRAFLQASHTLNAAAEDLLIATVEIRLLSIPVILQRGHLSKIYQ